MSIVGLFSFCASTTDKKTTKNPQAILIVLTSNDRMGDTDYETGFWLEEFTTPYYAFKDAGFEVVLASPEGGTPPADPRSELRESDIESINRYYADQNLKTELSHTIKLSDVDMDEYDAVFYPGGHGPMWDLVNDTSSVILLKEFVREGKVVSAVCHGPSVFKNVYYEDGTYAFKDIVVTGYSNSEEFKLGFEDRLPFLLEDALTRAGADYVKGEDGKSYVAVDGNVITGQNPASSEAVAQAVIKKLEE